MTTVAADVQTPDRASAAPLVAKKRRMTPARLALHLFLGVTALIWVFPVGWALINSFRDYQYTAIHGYVSWGGFTLSNYAQAWDIGNFSHGFLNSLIITVPAVILTLLLSSCVAFVVSRFSFKFNLAMLGLFTAANLLPQQALLIPLFRMYKSIPLPEWLSDSGTLYDTYWGLILINVAFQTGFCSFVLSNYMKTLPRELYEAAEVDGASIWRQYWQLTMPLCRPPLAALATLLTTWIYNEFFWAVVLMTSGDKYPVTSSLQNLKGEFFTDNNLVSAGSVMVALPTLLVFFLLQRQFVSGLTLGATKG